MGQNEHSPPEPGWLWGWGLEGQERCPVLPPLEESPLRQDSVTADKVCGSWTWRGAQQRGTGGTGLTGACWMRDSFPQNPVHADLIPPISELV